MVDINALAYQILDSSGIGVKIFLVSQFGEMTH